MLSGLAGSLAQVQIVAPSLASQNVAPGRPVTVAVDYTTSPENSQLTGLGVRLHYNSSVLTYQSLTGVLPTPVQSSPPTADSLDLDADPATDKYIFVAWADVSAGWPGVALPARLYTARFTAAPAAAGATTIRFTASSTAAGWTFSGTPATIRFAQVVGRAIFYNNSAFDGNNPAASPADDAAIAADKQALLPGQRATWQNATSYHRGINGIIVDVNSAPDDLSLADFQFRAGNSDTPSTWTAPSASPTISVRRGAGAGGADRVTLIWPDNTLRRTWLQVTALPASSAPDVFYFGNAPGETGDVRGAAVVDTADLMATRSYARSHTGAVTVQDTFDHNRDGAVNAADYNSVIGLNRSSPGNSLRLVQPIAGAKGTEAPASAAVWTVEPAAEKPLDELTLYAWAARNARRWQSASDSVLSEWRGPNSEE